MAKLRDDLESIRRSVVARGSGLQSTLFAGRIVDLGGFPATSGRFVAVQPMVVGGDETEGGATTTADATGPPVIAAWLGSSPPVVGTTVIVESVANRWVAHRNKPAATCVETDNFCCIPMRTLAIFYSNGLSGGNSDSPVGMGYDGATTWQAPSSPTGSLGYKITAAGGHGVFWINFDYDSAGIHEVYRTESENPSFGLTLYSKVCQPFQLVFRPTGGSANRLVRLGYTQFVVSQ